MGSQKKEERAGQQRRSRVRQIKAGIRGRAWQNQEAGRKTGERRCWGEGEASEAEL